MPNSMNKEIHKSHQTAKKYEEAKNDGDLNVLTQVSCSIPHQNVELQLINPNRRVIETEIQDGDTAEYF